MSGSTPTDSGPPPEIPAVPGQLLRTPDAGREPSFDKKAESLKQEVTSILKDTEWPTESRDAAEGLLNAANSFPHVFSHHSGLTKELQILVERHVQTLDDVCIRLKDASSKPEMERWKFLEQIGLLAFDRPSKCALLFRTCQEDLSNSANAVEERLISERTKEERATGSLGLLPNTHVYAAQPSNVQSVVQEQLPTTGENVKASTDSTRNSLSPLQIPSNTTEEHTSIRNETLGTSCTEAGILCSLDSAQSCKEDLDSALDVDDDLTRFLQVACTHIRNDHNLPEDWPSPGDLKQLVQMSQGSFQWARTVVTYIGNGSPVDRLQVLLKRPSAWSGLDNSYRRILSKAFDSVRLDPVRKDILSRAVGTLVVAPHPISLDVMAALFGKHEIFNGTPKAHIIPFLHKDVLSDLNSLLFIPELPTEPMRLMHPSIRDLLATERRSNQQPPYVDIASSHQELANICLDIMLGSLKEKICNLSDVSKPASEVQDIVERDVSKEVQYCCRAWPTHLTQGFRWPTSSESGAALKLDYFERFSKGKIMQWLEVMCLIGATADAIIAARQVHRWLVQSLRGAPTLSPLAALWEDVWRFTTTFSEPISFGPLQIYTSALPHCPANSEIWNLYGKHAKVQVLHGHQMSTWPSDLWTRPLDAGVNTVAFSPDGRAVAIGSGDRTIRLLDAQTGAVVGEPLTGHSGTVWSVCFSPDGKLLASGSDDHTVRLWDTETGVASGEPLMGRTGGVYAVCFSPDGKLLAAGALDKTVRLWNAQTGEQVVEPLKGHRSPINSLSFSPDGKLLASGSHDRTIRLWNAQTGMLVGEPLTGHDGWVWSVRFSPDGSLLASGSSDEKIRVWNTDGRALVYEPLVGHSGGVNSVSFSPDGKLLASGSSDGTIRLWNAQTGAASGEPLTGHTSRVWSVSFSSDGKRLASASDDATVRLWDPQAGAAVTRPPNCHRVTVNSVCFSPDGKYVASGSDDRTILLWDSRGGAVVGEPLTGHSEAVLSVCFSPDGKLLASGSNDRTVRLWDSQAGVVVGEPLEGHSDSVTSVSFSPDGTLLMAQCRDGSTATWDVITHQRCDTPRGSLSYENPRFEDHWIKLNSSPFLWLPPRYWSAGRDAVALFNGQLAAFQDGSLSILDVSQIATH